MQKDQHEDAASIKATSESSEASDETAFLRASQRLLDMPVKAASEIADVALIFYSAVGTIIGSLLAACVYPLVHPYESSKPTTWIFFLLCSVAVGSVIGLAAVSLLLNARGYISWEKKYRD
jgi:hypothetical protein